MMRVEVEVVADAQRMRPPASEVERLWAATDKARDLLGWQARYGGLEGFRRGLAETIDWYREPGNLTSYRADTYNL
jgi:dTDP-glucose 4,6-dehydratase